MLLSFFKNKLSNPYKVTKDSEFVVWINSKAVTEFADKSVPDFLLDEARKDIFYKTEITSSALVSFVFSIMIEKRSTLLQRQINGLLGSLVFKESLTFNPEFFNLFEAWDALVQEDLVSLEDRFIFLKKILPALSSEAKLLLSLKDPNKNYAVLNSPGFSSLSLLIDDILSEYGYEVAYHEKEFRDSFSEFIVLLEADIYAGEKRYYPQAPHYLSLKTRIFAKNYSFLSEVGVGVDDAYNKYVGVSYSLQSDLYKFSNLVFFSVEDLEKMYMFASNYFGENSLIVKTRVSPGYSHEGELRIIDERKSFIYDYEKIRGHMNFPDIFTSIMKNSYVSALNGVITTQMEYKMGVADSVEANKLNDLNTMQLSSDEKNQDDVRVTAFLKFLLREINFDYAKEENTEAYRGLKAAFLSGYPEVSNTLLERIKQSPAWRDNKVKSNALRYLVFVNAGDLAVKSIVYNLLADMKEFDSDLMVFNSISFDVRKSRNTCIKYVVQANKAWAESPEDYTWDYLRYDLRKNKVFSDDDFICSYVMDSLFKKWTVFHSSEKKEDQQVAYELAIKIKDFYTLVILNSSAEYENDFWEKYSVMVDRIYHEYVYEKDTGGTELVLVSNFDLRRFWNNKENKYVSIKRVWTALERFKASEALFKRVFEGNGFYIKYDTTPRRGAAYNDTFTVIMANNQVQESLFNRLLPKWIKHCMYSDDLTFEKMTEVIESGRKATVSSD